MLITGFVISNTLSATVYSRNGSTALIADIVLVATTAAESPELMLTSIPVNPAGAGSEFPPTLYQK